MRCRPHPAPQPVGRRAFLRTPYGATFSLSGEGIAPLLPQGEGGRRSRPDEGSRRMTATVDTAAAPPRGDAPVLALRMDGRVPLPARPQRAEVDLGHRRLLLSRHRARRRGADRRHVGDERLPPRPAREDDRPQRPHVPAGRRDAADRLRGGDRAGQQGSGRDAGAAAGRGPGLRHLAVRFVGRAGARHPRAGSRAPAGRRGASDPGLARRLRRGAGGGGRREARRPSEPQGRRQGHHHRAARRRDAVRRHAADEGLYRRRHLPDRHGDLRQHLHLHAARRGADLLQLRGSGQRDRGLCRRSRPHGRDAPRDRAGRSSGR